MHESTGALIGTLLVVALAMLWGALSWPLPNAAEIDCEDRKALYTCDLRITREGSTQVFSGALTLTASTAATPHASNTTTR